MTYVLSDERLQVYLSSGFYLRFYISPLNNDDETLFPPKLQQY